MKEVSNHSINCNDGRSEGKVLTAWGPRLTISDVAKLVIRWWNSQVVALVECIVSLSRGNTK